MKHFLTLFNNALNCNRSYFTVASTANNKKLLEFFYKLGYISSYSYHSESTRLLVRLNSYEGALLLSKIVIYRKGTTYSLEKLRKVHRVEKKYLILSTSQGLKDINTALELGISGEVVCELVK